MVKSPCLGVAFSLTSLNLGVGNWKVEKQKLEGRKMGDQKRLTCPGHKVKERNVANNDEKFIWGFLGRNHVN